MFERLRNVVAAAALAGASLLAPPALAMTWAIYAPDEDGYRYWIDTDSIQHRGAYVYFSFVLAPPDQPAPTAATRIRQSAINCATGDSLEPDASGAWVAGPHYTAAAYLYKFVCQR